MLIQHKKLILKLPHLPFKVKFFFTKIIPWFALLSGIFNFLAIVLTFLMIFLSLINFNHKLFFVLVGTLFLVTFNVLFLIKSFKPLRRKNLVGWIYLLKSKMVETSILLINLISGEISGWQHISLAIGSMVLSIYLLYEIRGFYSYREKIESAIGEEKLYPKP